MRNILLPQDIIFASYSYKNIPAIIKKYGSKVLLVTGQSSLRKSFWGKELIKLLKRKKIRFYLYDGVCPEPDSETVEKGITFARSKKCDLVLGVGGGSVLDVAKTIAGLYNEKFKYVSEYLYGKEIKTKGLLFIAVPTTAGTGSEVTKNAVLEDRKKGVKTSIRSLNLLPHVALVDPALTLTLPRSVTLYSALDALTHAVEAYVSKEANFITAKLSLEAIELIYRNLPRCLKNNKDIKAREAMSFASLISGVSFSNAGLGLAHALSHPIGVLYKIPHGLINAILLPWVVKYNSKCSLAKFRNIVRLLVPENKTKITFYELLRKLNRKLNIASSFKELGLELDARRKEEIIRKVKYSGSLKYNPREVSEKDIRIILEGLWSG